MKTQDPHSELQDGFELAPPPPIGPDGAPLIPPQHADAPPRPSLCHAGPCVHYHRLVTQVDAENPRAVRLPIALPVGTPGAEQTQQGSVYRAPVAFHVEVHHYCYPDVGIEMPLGSLPVVECNRWHPSHSGVGDAAYRQEARERFGASLEGREYRDKVTAWEDARAVEAAEAAEAERLIARSLVPDEAACQVCGHQFALAMLDDEMRCGKCRTSNLIPRLPPKETP